MIFFATVPGCQFIKLKFKNYETTSACVPSAEYIFVTVISFFVRVPVLSEHITLAQPEI